MRARRAVPVTAALADLGTVGDADEAVHASAVDVLLAGEGTVRASRVVDAVRIEKRLHALADAVRHAHGRHAVLHGDPVGVRIGAEEGVERAVLLHDHDHVLDHVDAVRPGEGRLAVGLCGGVAATRQSGECEQEQSRSQLNGG